MDKEVDFRVVARPGELSNNKTLEPLAIENESDEERQGNGIRKDDLYELHRPLIRSKVGVSKSSVLEDGLIPVPPHLLWGVSTIEPSRRKIEQPSKLFQKLFKLHKKLCTTNMKTLMYQRSLKVHSIKTKG